MDITSHMRAAFALALTDQQELQRRWVDVWFRFYGMGALQAEQSDGRMDILLRKIEFETLERLSQSKEYEIDLAPDIQRSFSQYWIMSMYETMRTIHESPDGKDNRRIRDLRRRFEMIRVPIAKGEIANDNRLKKPVILSRFPHGGDYGDPDPQSYSEQNKIPYRPVSGICMKTGSCAWYPFNSITKSDEMISRRMLSDECLALFESK